MKRLILLLVVCTGLAPCAMAQFSGSLFGTVLDSSGAVVPGVALQLRNTATNVVQESRSDAQGNYHFNSLAPSTYDLIARMQGFSDTGSKFTLETNQTLNLDIKLAVGGASQTVVINTEAPMIDVGDTRLEQTLNTAALSSLPLAGRSMISLIALAPGVSGLGVTSNGSPGSGRDNYSTETSVDASANGQGSVSNMYVLDGLDIDSDARPGVLNMTPNPDAIQETSIQTNTYNVDYGRATSLLMTMTTKSGTSDYHGSFGDYYTYENLFAGTEFTHKYTPFHTNNFSGTIGGPIIPHRQFFFFFAIEPQRASAGASSSITFEDPLFTQFAKSNFPDTLGTQLLTTYPVSRVTNEAVLSTAEDTFPTTCGTAATSFIPCDLPMVDSANFSTTTYRNANQYSVRIDKPFRSDRLYGTFFRTTNNTDNPNPRAAFVTPNHYFQKTFQVSESHTFSPNTLNQAAFGMMRDEGIQAAKGLFSVPIVGVVGVGQGFGSGFAVGDFIQHNYHWRDVLTHTYKTHSISAGYDGYFADDVELFGNADDQPNFTFDTLLDLAQDNPHYEAGVSYNPLTGKQTQWVWDAAGTAHGLFLQDAWRLNRRVNVNYGVRWDDYGNPYSRAANTVLANFYFGSGQTMEEQTANGSLIQHHNSFPHNVEPIFSPRVGIAWDITGTGKWLLKGGAGLYHNWPTLAVTEEIYRGNPPGPISPTFYRGQDPAPIFAMGTSNTTPPYGFPYPELPARNLDQHGGIQGLQFTVGGIDPNLDPPKAYTYSASLERQLREGLVANATYTGTLGRSLFAGGNNTTGDVFGVDINILPDDLIIHNSTVPTRLNSSFGQIIYEMTDRVSNYNALILSLRGSFHNSFITASYTRSQSKDDMGGSQGTPAYPTYVNPHQWYGPSVWDIPNRFSVAWNYELPNPHGGAGMLGRIAGGWGISGTATLQSGPPFNVFSSAPFLPLTDDSGTFIGYAPGSGDFNADGDNYDFPDVNSYKYSNSRKAYLQGVFTPQSFSVPSTFGAEGNEKWNLFRSPGFEQWDAALAKNTKIKESMNLQLRFEFFNVFNRPNLTGVVSDLADGNFGKSTGQNTPRFMQFSGSFKF